MPLGDPTLARARHQDVGEKLGDEIEHFQRYKELEERPTETRGFGNRAIAHRIIDEARERNAAA